MEFFGLDKPLQNVFGANCSDADEIQSMPSINSVGQVIFGFFFYFLGKQLTWNLLFLVAGYQTIKSFNTYLYQLLLL